MDRQTKIDVLQKELSRKDLTFGCLMLYKDDDIQTLLYKRLDEESIETTVWKKKDMSDYTNLWHPVILSDVLLRLKKNHSCFDWNSIAYTIQNCYPNILNTRDLTKPYLSEQSEKVVDGLYEVYLLTKKD